MGFPSPKSILLEPNPTKSILEPNPPRWDSPSQNNTRTKMGATVCNRYSFASASETWTPWLPNPNPTKYKSQRTASRSHNERWEQREPRLLQNEHVNSDGEEAVGLSGALTWRPLALMWFQMSLTAPARDISGAPPANLLRASETGTGCMIPRFSFACAASVLVTFAPAADADAEADAGLLPPAAAMRNLHPRKTLAAAAMGGEEPPLQIRASRRTRRGEGFGVWGLFGLQLHWGSILYLENFGGQPIFSSRSFVFIFRYKYVLHCPAAQWGQWLLLCIQIFQGYIYNFANY